MKIIRSAAFKADRPWGATDIAVMNGITARLHWTDTPYRWHVNDGDEVFAVMNGRVEMRYREGADEKSVILEAGDIFHASAGEQHVAYPIGEARILVVEQEHADRDVPVVQPSDTGATTSLIRLLALR